MCKLCNKPERVPVSPEIEYSDKVLAFIKVVNHYINENPCKSCISNFHTYRSKNPDYSIDKNILTRLHTGYLKSKLDFAGKARRFTGRVRHLDLEFTQAKNKKEKGAGSYINVEDRIRQILRYGKHQAYQVHYIQSTKSYRSKNFITLAEAQQFKADTSTNLVKSNTKYVGISFVKREQKYRSTIRANNTNKLKHDINIGTFKHLTDAVIANNKRRVELGLPTLKEIT